MGEISTEKAPKKSWWKEFKGEFKKIIWLDKKSLFKQTIVVAVVSVVMGALIAVLDLVLKYGIGVLQLRG